MTKEKENIFGFTQDDGTKVEIRKGSTGPGMSDYLETIKVFSDGTKTVTTLFGGYDEVLDTEPGLSEVCTEHPDGKKEWLRIRPDGTKWVKGENGCWKKQPECRSMLSNMSKTPHRRGEERR